MAEAPQQTEDRAMIQNVVDYLHTDIHTPTCCVPPNTSLYVERIRSRAVIPTRSTPGSAGLDLYAPECIIIPTMETVAVATGLRMIIPAGCYGRIAPRSGLALRNQIIILGGVVDNDYRGEIVVILFNAGKNCVHLTTGSRIAQIILEKYHKTSVMDITGTGMNTTLRGANAFGSTERREAAAQQCGFRREAAAQQQGFRGEANAQPPQNNTI